MKHFSLIAVLLMLGCGSPSQQASRSLVLAEEDCQTVTDQMIVEVGGATAVVSVDLEDCQSVGPIPPIPPITDGLQPDDFDFAGFYRLPNSGNFTNAMAIIPDCMGRTDPSPDDGYPGCLLMGYANKNGEVGLFDIVEPTPTGLNTATQVVDRYLLVGAVPAQASRGTAMNGNEVDKGIELRNGSVEMSGLTYVNDVDGCRIYWQIFHEYANEPNDDSDFMGYSSCDPDNPNPQGMWRWDDRTGYPDYISDLRATKWIYNMTRAPQDVADEYFEGKAMVMGPGKSSGSRNSSSGPSAAIREWSFPASFDDDIEGSRPLFFYDSSTGYPRWYNDTAFRGGSDVNSTLCFRTLANMVVRTRDGKEALLTIHQRGVVDPDQYPHNDPDAAPDQPHSQPPGGWPKYNETALYPNTSIPSEYYGVPVNNYGSDNPSSDKQQPSHNDYTSTGGTMPWDTKVTSTCNKGTGPSCQAYNMFLAFYDLPTLSESYQGLISAQDLIQPYAELNVTTDTDDDGWQRIDSCEQPGTFNDAEWDIEHERFYFSAPSDASGDSVPYNQGGNRGIWVYQYEGE